VGCLPWLSLLGRCLLLFGMQLQQVQQSLPDLGQRFVQARCQAGASDDQLAWVLSSVLGVHASHPVRSIYQASTWCTMFEGCQYWHLFGKGLDDLA
jgi:hypothetical protein